MRVEFKHFRVLPDYNGEYRKRGKPSERTLLRYSRRPDEPEGKHQHHTFEPFPRGGMTVCTILSDDGTVIAKAAAICSMADQFSYKKRRAISYGRALKLAEKNKGE